MVEPGDGCSCSYSTWGAVLEEMGWNTCDGLTSKSVGDRMKSGVTGAKSCQVGGARSIAGWEGRAVLVGLQFVRNDRDDLASACRGPYSC